MLHHVQYLATSTKHFVASPCCLMLRYRLHSILHSFVKGTFLTSPCSLQCFEQLSVQGCAKGERCQFAHVREDDWDGPEMQHVRTDRGRFAADRSERRDRDRSQ